MSAKTKWEGEDAEEVVKDSWDQDSEDEKPEREPSPPPVQPVKKPQKKDVKKRVEAELGEEAEVVLTGEELIAEKLRQQKLQEESDLILAKEIFGSTTTKGIESKEEFDKFKSEILRIVEESAKSTNFATFTEELIHGLCVHLCSADLKKISTWLSDLIIEKGKLERGEKPKKKPKTKAKIKLENETNYSEYSAYVEDDFDDFI